jgi:ABC-type sugar transport systems, ATPase components
MAEIRIENLHKAFGDFVAVKDSSFTVAMASSSACSAPRAAARRRRSG